PPPKMNPNSHPSYQATIHQTAPYSSRPPSPPYIHVPPPSNALGLTGNPQNTPPTTTTAPNNVTITSSIGLPTARDVVMTIHPSPAAIHNLSPFSSSTTTQPVAALTAADLATITASRPQFARDNTAAWVYEARRAAQPVLDYLYLGPASSVKDRAFLAREGITMVLCARDARFAAPGGGEGMLMMGVKRAVEGTGVVVEGIDIADGRELVGAFSVAAGRVNEHCLAVARQGGRGKVLVVCETGNERSAAVVAAYLMAMYGLDLVQAVQFMQLQRFCVALGDELKFWLQAYGDILRARGVVGMSLLQRRELLGLRPEGNGGAQGGGKRRIEEMDEGGEGAGDGMDMDGERYAGRSFAPFVDRDY
ncbi:protein-tyrosine phosphatase-like protein, partial [Staphylotrichum tortipilum]